MNFELKIHGKWKNPIRFIILNSSFIILLSSCSIEKQISKSAQADVLNTKALQAAHVGISIYDPAANKYLYNYQGDKYFVPASNTKIPTCYAAMKYLGDSLVGLRYIIQDDTILIVQGTGDPTLLHSDFSTQPVFKFLRQFKYISLEDDNYFSDYFGNGWSWNDYQEPYMTQRGVMPFNGNIVSFRWLDRRNISVNPTFFKQQTSFFNEDFNKGITVNKPWGQNIFSVFDGEKKTLTVPFTPDITTIASLLQDTLKILVRANLLPDVFHRFSRLHSQPTDSLLKPMMHRSDNFFAEQSLLMVSNERLGVMNDAKIIDTILKTDFKDLPQKPRWADGSGLSRYNLFTPKSLVAILNKMKNEFGMERIKVIFPTGGEGTISSYYKADSGYIYAKTGTLSGVVAFSGYLYTRKGKLLIFSTLVNNHQASATDIRRAIEKFLQGIREKF